MSRRSWTKLASQRTKSAVPVKASGRSKYRAQKTKVDDILFDSKKEAAHYHELRLLERIGKITNLELQPEYSLSINDKHCFTYKPDFQFMENGELVIQDVKGFKTPVYRLKKKLIEAAYGIRIVEI
jgi:hypothetical protein